MLVATCQSCGQHYEARLDLAGQMMQCPTCGGCVVVPSNTIVATPADGLLPLGNEQQAVAIDPSVAREVDAFNEQTQSSAARPGMLRVGYLRYVYLFPMVPVLSA